MNEGLFVGEIYIPRCCCWIFKLFQGFKFKQTKKVYAPIMLNVYNVNLSMWNVAHQYNTLHQQRNKEFWDLGSTKKFGTPQMELKWEDPFYTVLLSTILEMIRILFVCWLQAKCHQMNSLESTLNWWSRLECWGPTNK